MLNYLWGAMLAIGVIWGFANGRAAELTDGALSGAKDAVTLCITMLGVMSMWTGLMEIAQRSGLIDSLTQKIKPFIHFMFPDIPPGHQAEGEISTNFIANILGLGWAATPAGLKAMKSLSELNRYSQTASPEMCTFLILNISSLQLIPVNVIAYRSQYGSVNPAAIIMPAIAATMISTAVGIVFAKIMCRKKE